MLYINDNALRVSTKLLFSFPHNVLVSASVSFTYTYLYIYIYPIFVNIHSLTNEMLTSFLVIYAYSSEYKP